MVLEVHVPPAFGNKVRCDGLWVLWATAAARGWNLELPCLKRSLSVVKPFCFQAHGFTALYCKVSVQKNIWYSGFFTKITCFQCSEGKEEICKGMFKLRHVGISTRSRFMVGHANTYVHSIRYNVTEKKFCSLLLPVVSENTNHLNYWLFHWYRFFKMS